MAIFCVRREWRVNHRTLCMPAVHAHLPSAGGTRTRGHGTHALGMGGMDVSCDSMVLLLDTLDILLCCNLPSFLPSFLPCLQCQSSKSASEKDYYNRVGLSADARTTLAKEEGSTKESREKRKFSQSTTNIFVDSFFFQTTVLSLGQLISSSWKHCLTTLERPLLRDGGWRDLC